MVGEGEEELEMAKAMGPSESVGEEVESETAVAP